MSYLKIPIDLHSAVTGRLKRCSYEESIAQQIMLLIVSRYEQRLDDVYVSVVLSEINVDDKKNVHVRRKAQITVKGKIRTTDQPFYFSTLVYISPLSQ